MLTRAIYTDELISVEITKRRVPLTCNNANRYQTDIYALRIAFLAKSAKIRHKGKEGQISGLYLAGVSYWRNSLDGYIW